MLSEDGFPFLKEARVRVRCCKVVPDLSHLGMIHHRGMATMCLIWLPKSFVELVWSIASGDETNLLALDDAAEGSSSITVICLLAEAVVRSGLAHRAYRYTRTTRPPGACMIHAWQVGSGTVLFFLVQKCTVLLMHNNKSTYSASVYVDPHGKEDPGLRWECPLFLNEARYHELEMLWWQQGIPREVAQSAPLPKVIPDNWH